VRWSFQFARAKQCSLILVRAHETNADQQVIDYDPEDENKDHLVKIIEETLQFEKDQAEDITATPHYDYHNEEEIATSMLKIPETSIKIIQGPNLAKLIFKIISQNKPSLLMLSRHQNLKSKKHYTDILFQRAHCSTMIIRLGDADFKRCSSLLVPCSGGPHCIEALIEAAALSESQGTILTPLIVESGDSDVMEEVGKHTLQKILNKCNIKENTFIKPRVETFDNVNDGISKVASEGFDMVIVGASEIVSLRKKLFGSLPERLMNDSPTLSVAVYRKHQPRLQVILDKIEYWCNLTVPQLNREQRVALYENLYMNSAWNFDFLALICLSTAIAALGLISNSAAVVIGAMLVAPLMVPILASGLALVQGNIPLILNAVKSISLGFLAALAIGFTCGLVTPMDDLTSEILSRGSPKLADMFIAFLSGVAAAHCMSRPKLSAALPGVAIAAALVPPIASTGIALSMVFTSTDIDFTSTAMGAAVLFFTNVVCIILGSAITFFAAGIRSKNVKKTKSWVQQCVIGLILFLSLLLIPLSSALISKLIGSQKGPKIGGIAEIAEKSLPILEKFNIIKITDMKVTSPKEGPLQITLMVDSSQIPDPSVKKELEQALSQYFKRPLNIKLRITLIIE
jgi:uncharacterized hydrophobic protein (TIGR00271 family)